CVRHEDGNYDYWYFDVW
nr:immunoglobulin heavy chain junction region [Mus musculus]